MENKVEQFILENQEALHHQLLDSLELYEFEKEYANAEWKEYQAWNYGYFQKETVDGITRYYKKGKKIYPKLTDEEYEKLLAISREKEHISEQEEKERLRNNPPAKAPQEFYVSPASPSSDSFPVKFMSALAWVLWIGGLIVAIMTARIEVPGRYSSETVFQWSVFISTVMIYFTAGGFYMCLSEVISDIRLIASSIMGFRASEKK